MYRFENSCLWGLAWWRGRLWLFRGARWRTRSVDPLTRGRRETHGCGAGSTKGTGSFSSVWQLAAVAPGGGPHESIRIDRSVTSRALDCVVNWRPRLPLQMCFTWAHMEWRLFNPHVGTPDPDPYSVRIRGQFVGWKTKKKKKTTTFILIIWTINSNDKYFF